MGQTNKQTVNRDNKTREGGRLDSLIMLMWFIVGFYRSTNVQKFLDAELKWSEKQRAAIRKKTLVSPNKRKMKQIFQMSCIPLNYSKINYQIMKKNYKHVFASLSIWPSSTI